jgi:hypothetical protein
MATKRQRIFALPPASTSPIKDDRGRSKQTTNKQRREFDLILFD